MPADTVLLCIDDGARRRLFHATLLAAPELDVVGTAAVDEGGVRAAAARQPDVVLVHADRPGLEGAKFIGRLRAVAPFAGVIAIAAAEDRPRSLVARTLAADRYVDPDVATADLLGVLLTFLRERPAQAGGATSA